MPLRILLSLVAVGLAPVVSGNQVSVQLKLSSTVGNASFTVRIFALARLLQPGHRQSKQWVGCGYTIYWGDRPASHSPTSDCAAGFTHT